MIKIETSKECIATVVNANGVTRQVFHLEDIHPDEVATLVVTCGTVTYLTDDGSSVTVGDTTVPASAPVVESPVTE